MFGEHESESPRVPSPWDPFLPSPPNASPSPHSNASLHNGIPKLVPEVEEGNIEYKLKLTHISNARFARLVTQLKWRLLEGGGQAYYELGVADSGALIGLSRADLEESLETLEMMAGEIGASVIVVKEIEVPPTIAALADKDSGYTDPDTGEWTHKMRRRPHLTIGGSSSDGGECSTSATSTTTTELDTDFSTADSTDIDEFPSSFPSAIRTPGIVTPSSTSAAVAYTALASSAIVHRPIRTDPALPTAQSSPFITPFDDDLALFSMEPEPAHREEPPQIELGISGVMADDELDTHFGFELGSRRSSFAGLEISAVYKPRPVRRRARAAATPLGPTSGRHGKRYIKNKEKKVHPWHQHQGQGGKSGKGGNGGQGSQVGQVSKEEKAIQRRLARDKKREEKRSVLITLAQGEGPMNSASPTATGENGPAPVKVASVPDSAVLATDAQQTETEDKSSALIAEVDEEASALVDGMDGLHAAMEESPETSPVLQVRQLAEDMAQMVGSDEREPRLIVEALVVRKMSIEEATLDFSRLALI